MSAGTGWPAWRRGDAPASLSDYLQPDLVLGLAPQGLPDDDADEPRLHRLMRLYDTFATAGIGLLDTPGAGADGPRPPEDVLAGDRAGSGLDLAVVAASAAVHAGLRPAVVLPDPSARGRGGRALLVVALDDDAFPLVATSLPPAVAAGLADGLDSPGTFVAVDIAGVTGAVAFADAVREGAALLRGAGGWVFALGVAVSGPRPAGGGAAALGSLATADAEERRRDRAVALVDKINSLLVRGQRAAAIAVAAEAVRVFRALAREHPAFERNLAGALDAYAQCLHLADERDRAAVVISEAVALTRQEAAAYPDPRHTASLAADLQHAAAIHADTGEPERALAAARESAALYRGLAAHDAASYRQALAEALLELATRLSANGERAEARAVATEAAALYRQLAEIDAAYFRPGLAGALECLAEEYYQADDTAEAVATQDRAVTLRREAHAEEHSTTTGRALAGALGALGLFLAEQGQTARAVAASGQAVSLLRAVVALEPGDAPRLALALDGHSRRLWAAGRLSAALTACDEALRIQRRHHADTPAVAAALAQTLDNRALLLAEHGEHGAALTAAAEAVEILRPLAADHPGAHTRALGQAVYRLASRRADLDDPGAALSALEAVELCVRDAEAGRGRNLRDLARALRLAAPLLPAAEDSGAGIAVVTRAAALCRRWLAEQDHPFVARSLGSLAASLDALGARLAAACEPALAAGVLAEAVAILAGLAQVSPEAQLASLGAALGRLVDALRAAGPPVVLPEAVATAVGVAHGLLGAGRVTAGLRDLGGALTRAASLVTDPARPPAGEGDPSAAAADLAVTLTLVAHRFGRTEPGLARAAADEAARLGTMLRTAAPRAEPTVDTAGFAEIVDALLGEHPDLAAAFGVTPRRAARPAPGPAQEGGEPVGVFDAPRGSRLAQIRAHTLAGRPRAVAFSPDGSLLAAGGEDRQVHLFQIAGGEQTQVPNGRTGTVDALAFSPGGTRLAVARADGTVEIVDLAGGAQRPPLTGHSGAVHAVAFSPAGDRLATGGHDGTVRLFDAVFGGELRVFEAHHRFRLPGRRSRARPAEPVRALAFSPDGSALASAGDDAQVRLWDVAGGHLLHTLTGHGAPVLALAFSPDATLLASTGADTDVRLWDVHCGQGARVLAGHHTRVLGLAFSADGAVIVSAGTDETLRRWGSADGHSGGLVVGRNEQMTAVAVDPTGTLLATAESDRSVRLWEVDLIAARQPAAAGEDEGPRGAYGAATGRPPGAWPAPTRPAAGDF